jgi:hypothetical protein
LTRFTSSCRNPRTPADRTIRLRIILSLDLACRPVSDRVNTTGLSRTGVTFHLRALQESDCCARSVGWHSSCCCLPDLQLLALHTTCIPG